MPAATKAVPVHQPVDAVTERLNDPAVAASLVTLLDNAELLSTLVLGLSGFIERGDTIMDSIAAGVSEFKGVKLGNVGGVTLPSASQINALTSALVKSTPMITEVLDSTLLSADSIALVTMLSDAMAEGMATAHRTDASVSGIRGVLRLLKDPEVGRGLGVLVEIAKAIGRRTSP